ncbi:MAG: UDP-N-acetylmuramoyl-tripeptide--D-alanyl-D-alanine ligase [Lachnospiraceae bacterium]|nr:UDP-N-acetylmuramoyl-tripeptide--D-alanyl-D-alanine ligase [Lachnospiraceae bacterium]
MIDFSLKEICEATGGKLYNAKEDLFIKGITTDSRKAEEGVVFVALRGENFDGHSFAVKACEDGALCVVSEEDFETIPYIKVKDTRRCLMEIARAVRIKSGIKVVGITGSVGKTTTKDMVSSVLSEGFSVHKTNGNFNNDIGLPLTVFDIENTHDMAVLEMGMNQFGEISRLSYGGMPDVAVITNVGVSHIENLGSREGILKAKSEIFDFMDENAYAVLNADDDMLITLKGKRKNIIWYGIDNREDIYADNIVSLGLEGEMCDIHTMDWTITVKIPIPGRHMVLNAMAAAGVGVAMGLSTEQIKTGIETFSATKMRMDISTTEKGVKIINDAYNANPVSMKAALDVLKNCEGRRIAVIGDMFELGDFAQGMHYDVGSYAVDCGIDSLIFIGEASAAMKKAADDKGFKNYCYYPSQEEFLNEDINGMFDKGDTVLVKASRGMQLEKTVRKIQEVK